MSRFGEIFWLGSGHSVRAAIVLALLVGACGSEADGPGGSGGVAGLAASAGSAGTGVAGGGASSAAGSGSSGSSAGMAQGGTSQQGAAGAGGSAGEVAGSGGAMGGAGGAGPDRSKRKLLLRDEGNSALHYVDLETPAKTWHQTIPVGRDLQVIGGRKLLIGTENGYEERKLDDGAVVKTVSDFPGTVSAHRLRNGNTLLSGVDFHGGKGINLVEVTPQGTVAKSITYPGTYVRLIRESKGGHYLVAAENRIFEGDAEGNVVWEVTVQGHAMPHAWEALRLASGDVLVSGGYAASLQIFGQDKQLKQTITGGDGAMPYFFADVQVMPGGSYVVANWQGHGTGMGEKGLQVLEYDTTGKLIWSWKQDASFVSSLQHLVVLDGLDLDKLQVESPESGVLEAVN